MREARNIIGKAQKSQLPSKDAPKKEGIFVASEHPEAFELFYSKLIEVAGKNDEWL